MAEDRRHDSAPEGEPARPRPRCDACDAVLEGAPAGRGLLVFPRGDRLHREEPPLCERCAHAIGLTAVWRFWAEEDEG